MITQQKNQHQCIKITVEIIRRKVSGLLMTQNISHNKNKKRLTKKDTLVPDGPCEKHINLKYFA